MIWIFFFPYFFILIIQKEILIERTFIFVNIFKFIFFFTSAFFIKFEISIVFYFFKIFFWYLFNWIMKRTKYHLRNVACILFKNIIFGIRNKLFFFLIERTLFSMRMVATTWILSKTFPNYFFRLIKWLLRCFTLKKLVIEILCKNSCRIISYRQFAMNSYYYRFWKLFFNKIT